MTRSNYLVPVCLGMGVAVMGLHSPALPFCVCSEAFLTSFGQNDSSARAFTPRVARPRGPIADDASTHAHARSTHTHTSPALSAAIAQDNHPANELARGPTFAPPSWWFCSTAVRVVLPISSTSAICLGSSFTRVLTTKPSHAPIDTHERACQLLARMRETHRVRLRCMVTDGCQETRGRRSDDCLSGLFETRRVLPSVTSLAQSERAATG